MLPRALVLLVLLAPLSARACPSDCDGDGTVGINELVLGVEIALGSAGTDRCAAADIDGDGQVAIQELIAGVDAALNGCADATPTATPSVTPGPLHCGDGTADPDEECDDGNQVAGDGCDAACQLEPGGNPCAGVAAFPGAALTSVLVTDGLSLPVFAGAPRLDPHRLFVVEQFGTIRIIKDGVKLARPSSTSMNASAAAASAACSASPSIPTTSTTAASSSTTPTPTATPSSPATPSAPIPTSPIPTARRSC